MTFKVGDMVGIANWGDRYTTHTDWFIEHINELNPEWLVHYAYNEMDDDPTKDEAYEVIFADYEDDKYLIRETSFCPRVYLVNHNALCKRMTLEEIEKELGYKIKLV